jgi:hypothetical protein
VYELVSLEGRRSALFAKSCGVVARDFRSYNDVSKAEFSFRALGTGSKNRNLRSYIGGDGWMMEIKLMTLQSTLRMLNCAS